MAVPALRAPLSPKGKQRKTGPHARKRSCREPKSLLASSNPYNVPNLRSQLLFKTHRLRRVSLLTVAFTALIPVAAHAVELPDAPTPQTAQKTPKPVPDTRPNTPQGIRARQWSRVVNPGETAPTLTAHDKLLLPLHEELSWTSPIPVLASAAYGSWTNSNPKYGSNGEAFGKRVGIGALQQTSTRILTDGLLPIAFHQDPRYYRKAYGSYQSRVAYALKRVVITRSDSGHKAFNFSGILGIGMGAALTQTYYPERSIGAGIVMEDWGTSILSYGAGNVFQEFWPDIRSRLFHQRK